MAPTATTHSRKAPAKLADIHKKVMLNGRCWGATTTDDVWKFDCTEGRSTPWLVWYLPGLTGTPEDAPTFQCGSLRQCRAAVACGAAGEELAMRLEEKRQQGQRLAEVRASCLAAGIRPVRPGEASPEPVGADREPGDLYGGTR